MTDALTVHERNTQQERWAFEKFIVQTKNELLRQRFKGPFTIKLSNEDFDRVRWFSMAKDRTSDRIVIGGVSIIGQER